MEISESKNKIDIKSLDLSTLTQQLKIMGQPSFRGKQIFSWLHEKRVSSFDGMSNLSLSLRETLAESYYISSLKIAKKLVSSLDGTIKYLFELQDKNCVESVLMKYKHGNSLCISTQVGCKMGCKFCASTLGGLVRCLSASEMLDEVYTASADSGERVSNVVLMGIGEPLDNYDNVLAFLKLLSAKEGYQLSLRHVSLSTCGLVDKINDLAKEKLGLTLSISLHAPNNEIRSKTMPINQKWDIDALLKSCKNYFEITGRRISFEYALIEGLNDQPIHAKELAFRLKGIPAHVNLIPVNPVKERGFRRTSRKSVDTFQNALEENGVNVTVRRELGADINAACGQLRREFSQKEGDNR